MAKRGRPKGSGSTYSQAAAEEICARIAEGETLQAICRDKGLVARTVYRWMDAEPEFASNIAKARLIGFDAIAAECMHIANTPVTGITETEKADGSKEIRKEDMLGHRKLQIWTRLQLLAKWDPKRYGDKTEHTVNGPVNLVVTGSDVHG